jgi:hypothetical protein
MKLNILFLDGLVGQIEAYGDRVYFSNEDARHMYEWGKDRSGLEAPEKILQFLQRQSGAYFDMRLTECDLVPARTR